MVIDYEDIRPYSDGEVNRYLRILVNDEVFLKVLFFIFKDDNKVREVRAMLSDVNSVNELQEKFMYPIIKDWIIETTTSGVTYSGLENLDKSQSYLFISNHRDIILDAALLNFIIFEAGMNTTEIAIGNNLFVYDWICHTVKLNRAFVVKRNLPVRELLTASKVLSSYIRKTITKDHMSVWLAQREGRTKDGNDKTQQSLLKMLNLSNTHSFDYGFRKLKIVPLSISYEREPCGISKVEELYKRKNEGFVKTPKDDYKSMAFGLTKPKGRVHFAFGKPIDKQLERMTGSDNLNDSIRQLADFVDECIYSNYKLWPNNYLAADILNKTDKHSDKIDNATREKFAEMLEDLVETIGSGDKDEQKKLFLQMYANPVLNAEAKKSLNNTL